MDVRLIKDSKLCVAVSVLGPMLADLSGVYSCLSLDILGDRVRPPPAASIKNKWWLRGDGWVLVMPQELRK